MGISYPRRSPFYYNAYVVRFYTNESGGEKDGDEHRDSMGGRTALRKTWKQKEIGIEIVWVLSSQQRIVDSKLIIFIW